MKKDLREKVDTILGAADWAMSRQSGEPGAEEEMPHQTEEVDMFNMMFGFDIFSGRSNFF